ncbi:type II toxin-antitoxin system ParD family antitoxin [Brevundimonas aurifodinae]|uniref:Type II toxin-antitoxin system ParD family antitoxin n=2 Tax=Brevundimonas TaxID=41275 RepID=A0ABV1NQX4_9CAUL|nr:MAG: addiction module antitoxin [Brevundimonas sp. 12-68-7]OYX33463.1 MAG: addiction module antitoxin [Brevundimonas subvibrioides]
MASSVDLGTKLESVVSRLVANGRYNSRSEVMREGVRLIHERETRLAALDASIHRGLADAAAGRIVDLDEAARTLDDRYSGRSDSDDAV